MSSGYSKYKPGLCKFAELVLQHILNGVSKPLSMALFVMLAFTSTASAVTLNLTYNAGLSGPGLIVLSDPSGAYRIDITVSGGDISISGNSVNTSFFAPTTAQPTVNFSANFPMSEITFTDMDNIDPNASRDSFAANVPGIWKNFGNSNLGESRTLSQFPLGSPPALGGGISFAELISRGAQSPVILNATTGTFLEDNFFVTFEPTVRHHNL